MLSLADMIDRLFDEFSGLGRSRLTFPLVSFRPFDGFLFRHDVDLLRGICPDFDENGYSMKNG